MSNHAAFRRQPVPQNYAQNLRTITLPAPTRGIIQHENEAFMQPGGAIVSDNWLPTLKGVKLRGGCTRYCDLHALDTPVPPVPSTLRKPVVSGFEYVSGSTQKMFAGQLTKLFDVTAATPVLVKSGQTSGNYSAAQITNAAGTNFLIAVNETGDYPLRFNGTIWVTLDAHGGPPADGASYITGPVGSPVEFGKNLSQVCKYRNRLFFVGTKSMSLWYIGTTNAPGGTLVEIPISGSFTKGGYILFAANWSIDAGDGIDDKLAVVTSEGEIAIFTGNNPADSTTWHQEGRYMISPPLGMNAWDRVGGDLLIMTVDGIVPISQAITKSSGQLELALITRPIKRMWRDEVNAKRASPWTMKKWDEFGAIFLTFPGGVPGARYCLAMNNVTGAFARCVGYDAMCFLRLLDKMFFGTQDGIIMQADVGGYDDGRPYVATLVGGWETFGSPSAQNVWHQARAVFIAGAGQPFVPQLAATVDYVVTIPPPPPAGIDPGGAEVWDQGIWDPATPPKVAMRWDQPAPLKSISNTLWQSIGMTGFAHAPILQVTVAQVGKPDVELIAISATYEPAGVNVD